MVGAGTVRADDPALTARGMGVARQPVRIVVSRLIDLPLMGQLARTARDVPVWICHGPDAPDETRRAWEGLGAVLLPCRLSGRQLDAESVLSALGEAGLTRVFCEGGGALGATLMQADLPLARRAARTSVPSGSTVCPKRIASASSRRGPWAGMSCTAGSGRSSARPLQRQRWARLASNPCSFDSVRLNGPGVGTAPRARRSATTSTGQGRPVTGSR